MSNSIRLIYNNIPSQHKTALISVTAVEWNNIINMLSLQTNNNSTRIEESLRMIEQINIDIAHNIKSYESLENFPLVGEESKLYYAITTRKLYVWENNKYVQVGGTGIILSEEQPINQIEGDLWYDLRG